MVKTEILRKYELVVIIDARLANDEKESVLKSVSETIVKAGGKVLNASVWMERHKMTFKINKCLEGTYFLINFEGESSVANQAKTVLRLNEKLLRLQIINID